MKVFLLVFFLQLVYGIPIYEGESSAAREDDVLAQDVKRNEGEKRFKRSCSVVPFDVQCHGHCPYDEYEWNSVRSNSNCSDERVGTTYHCIDPEDESGNPIEACGVPKYCDKGKGPVISFPKGHSKTADIDCDWCPEDYFNPSESIRSDNNSKCPKVRNDCGRHGLIECDKVTGEKRHWTDSKCECDIKNNYFPLEGENKCTGQSINCVWNQPCKKSLEGFDQIYIYSMSEGKYVCQRGCKEGFEFKTSQSTECEPVQVEINSTRFENETTIYNSSSTMLVSATTTGSYTTTETKPNTTTKIAQDAEKAGNNVEATALYIIIIGMLVILAIVYIVVGFVKCCKTTSGASGDGRGRYEKVTGSRVSDLRIVFCCPCNLSSFKEAPKITSLPTNCEVCVKIDELLKLEIGILGSPTPTVTWLKDGNSIVGATESNNDGVAKLEIQSAKRSDAGKYQIQVNNEIGSVTADISVIVHEAPKITRLPADKKVHVKVDEPLILDIGISGSPTPTVAWLKDGNPIVGATESNNDGVAKLEIPRAKHSDAGKYQIKVDNEIDSVTADISVIVCEDPKITRLPADKKVHVKVDEPLILDIGISGSPTPTVTWLKDGNPIVGATESNNDGVVKLEIQSAKRSDAGKYQIKVDNEIDSVTDDISVIVCEAPKITRLPADRKVHVEVDEPLTVDIGISGSPTPTVTWLKDGNPIVGATYNDTKSKMKIPKAERSDTGKYQIKVENEKGSDTAEISVIVLDKQTWIEELPKDLLDTSLTSEMCVGLQDCFGKEWEIIAKHMKFKQPTIDNINADMQTQSLRIDRMIYLYVNINHPAVGDFLRLLKSCSQTPTIEWILLKKHFEKIAMETF